MNNIIDYVSLTTGEVFTHENAIKEWLNGDTIGIYKNGKYTGCKWIQ